MADSSVYGCGKCLKYFLVLFTGLTFFVGVAVTIAGFYTLLSDFGSKGASAIFDSDIYLASSYTLVAGGGLILFVSFCGFCGSWKEDRGFLCLFFVMMMMLVILFVVAGALGFVFKDQVQVYVKAEMETRLIYKYGVDLNKIENKEFTEAWDNLQTKLKCCGLSGDINSTTSWAFYRLRNTSWFQLAQSKDVPESCCDPAGEIPKCDGTMTFNGPPRLGPPVVSTMMMNEALYPEGCYDKLMNSLEMNAIIIGSFAFATLGLMVIGIIFSMCLCRQIESSHEA